MTPNRPRFITWVFATIGLLLPAAASVSCSAGEKVPGQAIGNGGSGTGIPAATTY